MKRFQFKQLTTGVILSIALAACQKQDKTQTTISGNIPENVINQIQAQGYSTDGIIKRADGYIVEGDIFLSNDVLNHPAGGPVLRIANSEQYQTTNLITGSPRNITVSCTGLSIL